jgi:hypothetical protein
MEYFVIKALFGKVAFIYCYIRQQCFELLLFGEKKFECNSMRFFLCLDLKKNKKKVLVSFYKLFHHSLKHIVLL